MSNQMNMNQGMQVVVERINHQEPIQVVERVKEDAASYEVSPLVEKDQDNYEAEDYDCEAHQSNAPVESSEYTQSVPSVIPSATQQYLVNAGQHNLPCIGIAQSIRAAGISFQQAQGLNHKILNAEVDMQILRNKHVEDLNFKAASCEQDMYYKGMRSGQGAQNTAFIMGGNDSGVSNNQKNNWAEMFNNRFHVVKERSTVGSMDWCYLVRDFDSNRHIPYADKELKAMFFDFVDDCAGDYVDESNVALNRMYEKMKRRVAKVNASGLQLIPDTSLVFTNGVLNIAEGKFSADLPENRFNRFSVDFDYPMEEKEPVVFDAMLDDIFRNHPEWKTLCYQIIGALLAPVPTLKKIYVFQGVSNAGKTRLSEIVMRLMDEMDIRSMNTLSDITSSSAASDWQNCRLVYIKEAANKKISSKQISCLKGYADGGQTRNAAKFKILMGTNYILTTGNEGELEPALRNRFLVLPFTDAMLNDDPRVSCFEDCYFEQEKRLIVKKALRAFGEVLENDGRFCTEPEINRYVEASDVYDISTGSMRETSSEAKKHMAGPIIDQAFELCEEINPKMTADKVMEFLKISAEKKDSLAPNMFKSKSAVSRLLNEHYSGTLKTERRSDGATYYNLRLKSDEVEK